jgi:hypothetical protein
MVDCSYCHKEIKKDDEFVIVGKYPSTYEKWRSLPPFSAPGTPENLGTIYHKSCFVEMINKGKS